MRWIPALAECVVGAMLAPAVALGAPVGADQRSHDATTVAEIFVTAEKREENLETVPIAISAYTSSQRDLHGVDTLQDLAKFTPGLQYSASSDRTYIRGVGRQTNNLSTEPGVATYFDGIYNASIAAASGDSLFLDRIEVLRGPQGTLYGKNAIGGAINAISRRPTDNLYAEARTDIGNYGVYNLEAAVSGPIADGVRFRIAGYRNDQQQGYFTDVSGLKTEGNNGVVAYLEGQMDAKIGSHVDVWLKVNTFTWDTTSFAGNSPSHYDETPFPPGTLGVNPGFGFTQPGFTEVGSATRNPGVVNLRDFNDNTPSRSQLSDDYNVTTEVTWHTPWSADLKYLGGYTQYRYRMVTDADGTSLTSFQFPTTPSPVCLPAPQCPPLTIFPTLVQNYTEGKIYFSNEIDLTSTGPSPLQWIVGLYQYHDQFYQDVRLTEPFQTQLSNPLDPTNPPTNAPPNPSLDLFNGGQTGASNSYAGFAQIDWSILPQLKVSGGLRYTYDQQTGVESTRQICLGVPACGASAADFGAFTPAVDITQFVISFAPAPGVVGPPTLNPATGFYSRALAGSWSAVTGTAGIEWTPDSNSLFYAKYSRGYTSGGFSIGTIPTSPETQPELLDAYEIGVKRNLGLLFQVNSALFYYNYRSMQIPLTVQPQTGPSHTVLFNLDSYSYGLELEFDWTPVKDLEFILNYAYLNSEIHSGQDCAVDSADPSALQPGVNTVGCPPGGSQNVSGQPAPQAPPNKVLFGGDYTLHFASGALTFSADYAWTDQTYDAIFKRPYYLAPAFNTVDMRLIWNDLKGRYTVILYGKNIFNALGFDNAVAGLMGDGTIGQGYGLLPPATYGVELQYRFR